jgi:hypothetical protein
MPDTFSKITTVTVGSGGAANITFSSIPQVYTDLCIKISARTTNAYFRDSVEVRPNGSAANQTNIFLIGQGTTVASGPQSNIYVEIQADTGTTANIFGSAEIYIPNYTSGNFKSFSIDAVTENNAASSNAVDITSALWSNTAAITSISLVGGGNFMQYSTATLYGIKNL